MNISYRLLQTITDFGDSAVISTATFGSSGLLAATGEPRAALRILGTMGVAAAMIACAKIYCLGCGNGFTQSLHVYSPSGHAALTTAFSGAVATYASNGRSAWIRAGIWLCAAIVTGSISLSRVLLGYHSATEIGLGFLIGCIAFFSINRLVRGDDAARPANAGSRYWMPALIVALMFVLHGHRLPAERIIRSIAGAMHYGIPFCLNA